MSSTERSEAPTSSDAPTESGLTEGWAARLRSMLPTGGQLPEDVWHARHLGVVALLWVHAVAVPVYALVRGFPLGHTIAESSVIPGLAVLATLGSLPQRIRTGVASVGLLTCSAILVHLSGGLIEMHFHFFIMVAVVALYQDWLPFLAAVGYVFVHHGFMGWLAPDSVFNHPAARRHPWLWASVHAFFISGISAACLIAWRLNERALAERRRAEDRLREESRVVESLHEVGKVLAADLDGQRVVQTVTDRATDLTGAEFGAFFYNTVDEAGESYLLYTLSGAPREAFSRFGVPRNTPIFAPTFAGEEIVRLDDVTADSRYGHMAPHYGMPAGHLPVRSYLAVPVRSRTGEILGGLFFGHPEPGQFSKAAERIAAGIASQAAIALDNARLFESERASRGVAEVASERLAVLAEASRILGSSLDAEVVLGAVGASVERLGAACCIDLFTDEGVLHRLVSGAVSVKEASARSGAPSLDDVDDPVVRAIQSRQSVVIEQNGKGGRPVGLVAPLSGREGVMGAITVFPAQSDSGPPPLVDRPFVEELARRVALALENARLYARQRTVAEILQHSLLPERLPELPGISTASRYLAGGPGVDVGGDWYDVIQLPAGRLAVAIGDVVGRGERAASLMGQLRNALRAYALESKDPVEIANNLNMLLLEAGREHMATFVLAVLDPENGKLTFVNAGHPPPLVADSSGASRFLEGRSGPPLGAVAGTNYRIAEDTLSPGDTLLLYTDGLIEERSSSIDAGLARLQQAVKSGPHDTDALCAHIVSQSNARSDSHDDIALLAVRLDVLGSRLRLRIPGDPNVMGPLRAMLRRWLSPVATSEECFDLLLAVGEASTNAIRHGLGAGGGHFEFEADIDDEVRITVRDAGGWKTPRPTGGGRGLAIIRSCVDDLQIDHGAAGTEVRMRRRLERAPEPVGAR